MVLLARLYLTVHFTFRLTNLLPLAGETAVGKEDATLIRVALCRILGALYCIGWVCVWCPYLHTSRK